MDPFVDKIPFDIDAAMERIREAVKPYPKAAMFELAEEGYASPFEQLEPACCAAQLASAPHSTHESESKSPHTCVKSPARQRLASRVHSSEHDEVETTHLPLEQWVLAARVAQLCAALHSMQGSESYWPQS